MKSTYQRYPDLSDFLETVAQYISSSLQVRSVISYAGITLDDFSKQYSTIEIVAVLEKGLWDKDYDIIDDIITSLQGYNEEYADMTKIFFIPFQVVDNPRIKNDDLEGMVTYGSQVELITNYPLNAIDNYLIRNHSVILYGDDLRNDFPIPPIDCFWEQFLAKLPKIENWVKEFPFQNSDSPDFKKAINRILYFPRLIYSLNEGTVIGKTKSVYWFGNEYPGNVSDFVLEVGMSRQRNAPLINIIDIAEKSKALLLLSLEKAFEMRKIKLPDLSSLVRKDDEKHNYLRLFMEMRNLLS